MALVLLFLGPAGVIGLTLVDYSVRYEYLIQQNPNVWEGLFHELNITLPIAFYWEERFLLQM